MSVIHPILKHKHRLAQMNCSLSRCLDYPRRFGCSVRMLVSHHISPLRVLTALMSLGTWPRASPRACPQTRTLFQPTRCEEGDPAIPSGGEQELGTQRSARSPTRVARWELGRDQWRGSPCGQVLPSCQYSWRLSCGGPSVAGSAASPPRGGGGSLTQSLWLPGRPGGRHLRCCASEGLRCCFWGDTTAQILQETCKYQIC